MNVANRIEYIATDEQRQVIPWVRLTDTNGVATVFQTDKFKGDPAAHTIRTMDCLDCHNRPAHHFRAPNDAVDLAMAAGRIDPRIPLVKSNVVAALTGVYATEEDALQKIATFLNAKYPAQPKTAALIGEVQRLYQANFFPEMKADWRSYPNNLGHKEWPGCFRCHDGLHKSTDGKTKIQASDCNSCHVILAQGSGEQLDKLNPKGYSFFHIDAINEDFSCNNCHTGAFPKEEPPQRIRSSMAAVADAHGGEIRAQVGNAGGEPAENEREPHDHQAYRNEALELMRPAMSKA